MKASNKVLILTFLLSASVIFVIPAFVNIKYASDHSIHDTSKVYRTVQPVKTILIKGISNCLIIPSDSFRVASTKNKMNEVLRIILKDTLSLTSKAEQSDSTGVTLYIPIDRVDLIISYSSNIRLWGAIRRDELPSYHIELHKSTLSLKPFSGHQAFNRLILDGRENSSFIVSPFNHITELILNNIDKIAISNPSEITDMKTTFDSKANVQMTKGITGTSITSKPQ